MHHILSNGVTGSMSQMQKIDVVANNIANINTNAYKRQNVSFSSLLYQKMIDSGKPVINSNQNILKGNGSKVSNITRDFLQGTLVKSQNPLSVAIVGNQGFFRLEDEQGNQFYTRDGSFEINSNGYLANQSGYFLPGIQINNPENEILINENGVIDTIDSNGQAIEEGRIILYSFNNNQALHAIGQNLYVATPESGEPQQIVPGDNNTYELKQGFIEMSNVELTMEMINLIASQRALQMNNQTIQIADQLWKSANNMRA